MIKYLVLCLVGVLYAVSSYASGSLQGHIYDEISGIPVGDALIRVLGSTISTKSESQNGFFSVIDIPSGAIVDNKVEILITKDGYHPQTLLSSLTDKRLSISIKQKETIVDTWLTRLKQLDGPCGSQQEIVEVIGNLSQDYPSLKPQIIDTLLQISTKYGFSFLRQKP